MFLGATPLSSLSLSLFSSLFRFVSSLGLGLALSLVSSRSRSRSRLVSLGGFTGAPHCQSLSRFVDWLWSQLRTAADVYRRALMGVLEALAPFCLMTSTRGAFARVAAASASASASASAAPAVGTLQTYLNARFLQVCKRKGRKAICMACFEARKVGRFENACVFSLLSLSLSVAFYL